MSVTLTLANAIGTECLPEQAECTDYMHVHDIWNLPHKYIHVTPCHVGPVLDIEYVYYVLTCQSRNEALG